MLCVLANWKRGAPESGRPLKARGFWKRSGGPAESPAHSGWAPESGFLKAAATSAISDLSSFAAHQVLVFATAATKVGLQPSYQCYLFRCFAKVLRYYEPAKKAGFIHRLHTVRQSVGCINLNIGKAGGSQLAPACEFSRITREFSLKKWLRFRRLLLYIDDTNIYIRVEDYLVNIFYFFYCDFI